MPFQLTPQILREAAALIAQPGAHCKDVYARDYSGLAVFPTDPAACAFCMVGAVARVTNTSEADLSDVHDAMQQLLDCPAHFNDDHSVPTVVWKLQEMADCLESQHDDNDGGRVAGRGGLDAAVAADSL